MTSIYSNTNINAFNTRQIRRAAVDTGVMTAATGNHPPQVSPAVLLAAVKAK